MFKFEIKQSDFPSGPPAIRILVDNMIGEVTTAVSTEYIPTSTTYNVSLQIL